MITKIGSELNAEGKKYLDSLEVQKMAPGKRAWYTALATGAPVAGALLGKKYLGGTKGALVGLAATAPIAAISGDLAYHGHDVMVAPDKGMSIDEALRAKMPMGAIRNRVRELDPDGTRTAWIARHSRR